MRKIIILAAFAGLIAATAAPAEARFSVDRVGRWVGFNNPAYESVKRINSASPPPSNT